MENIFLQKNKILLLIFFAFLGIVFFLTGAVAFLYTLYFIVIIYFVISKKDAISESKFSFNKRYILIPIIIFLFARIFPFAIYGPHPLGYDTGFYNYNIEKDRAELSEGNIWGLHGREISIDKVESLGSKSVNKILISLGFSNKAIMYWFYIGIGFFSMLLLYFLVRRIFTEEAALFSLFLCLGQCHISRHLVKEYLLQ